MKKFVIHYINNEGQHKKKEITGSDAGEARNLVQDCQICLSVKELKSFISISNGKMSLREIKDFTALLSLLINANLTVRDSLKIIATSSTNKRLLELANELEVKIQKGESFYNSLKDSKAMFPPFFLTLVKMGERTGDLKKVFKQLNEYFQYQFKLRNSIGNALLYPGFILSVLAVGGILLKLFIMPKIQIIIKEIGSAAALDLERNFQALSRGLLFSLIFMIITAVIVVIISILRKNDEEIRLFIDGLKINNIIYKKFFLPVEVLNFTFSIEVLCGAGITLDDALAEYESSVKNEALKKIYNDIKKTLQDGSPLIESFSRGKFFPEHFIQWVGIGEKTGKVIDIFSQIRYYYQEKVNQLLEGLMKLIEPAITVLVGIIMIFGVIFFVIPILTSFGTVL